MEIVGGSTRDPADGHWNLNCQQFDFRNYSLNVIPGYYHSTNENCLVCDMVQGPFLLRSALLQNLKFDEEIIKSQLVSLDFFLRVNIDFYQFNDTRVRHTV